MQDRTCNMQNHADMVAVHYEDLDPNFMVVIEDPANIAQILDPTQHTCLN